MISIAGEKYLLDEEIGSVAMAHPDGSFASEDLYTAIDNGNYPEWYLYIQTIDPSAQQTLDFDPLDPTKACHNLPALQNLTEMCRVMQKGGQLTVLLKKAQRLLIADGMMRTSLHTLNIGQCMCSCQGK